MARKKKTASKKRAEEATEAAAPKAEAPKPKTLDAKALLRALAKHPAGGDARIIAAEVGAHDVTAVHQALGRMCLNGDDRPPYVQRAGSLYALTPAEDGC